MNKESARKTEKTEESEQIPQLLAKRRKRKEQVEEGMEERRKDAILPPILSQPSSQLVRL